MRLLGTGDWHLRWGKPRNRIDDYTQTQEEKVGYLFDVAYDKQVYAILEAGDMTENYPFPKFPHRLLQKYIAHFIHSGIPERITIWGQHDGNYHADFENTPLKVMEAAEAIRLLDSDCNYLQLAPDVHVYGVGWDESIPNTLVTEGCNILLIHKMISNVDYWSGHVSYSQAQDFLASHPEFELVVSGDNHHHFMVEQDGRYLVNCGSLMRTNIDQQGHKPVFYIYDTDDRTIEKYEIPIASAEEVFDLENYETLTSNRKEARAFIEELGRRGELSGFDFEQDLQDVMEENPEEIMARLIIEEVRRKNGR